MISASHHIHNSGHPLGRPARFPLQRPAKENPHAPPGPPLQRQYCSLLASQAAKPPNPRCRPDPSTPKGALKCLVIAMDQGQAVRMRSLLAANNTVEAKIAGGMSDMAVAVFNMNKAMEEKFGKEQAQRATDSADQLKQSLANIDLAGEKIDGDTATVSIAPTRQGTMSLKKANGSWKISVEQQARGLTPSKWNPPSRARRPDPPRWKMSPPRFKTGKYATADEATAALRTKVGSPRRSPQLSRPNNPPFNPQPAPAPPPSSSRSPRRIPDPEQSDPDRSHSPARIPLTF